MNNCIVNFDGECFVIESWHNDKKITIYITPEKLHAIKIPFSGLIEDMQDIILDKAEIIEDNVLDFFKWINLKG